MMVAKKNLRFLYLVMCFMVFVFNYNETRFLGLPAYTWTNLVVIVYIGFSILHIVQHGSAKLAWNSIFSIFLLFVFSCFISIVYSYSQDASISRTIRMLELFILSLCIYQQLGDVESLNEYCKMFMWASVFASIYLLLLSDRTQRIGDIVGDANQIGITLAFASTMALYFLRLEKKKYYYAIIALLAIAILFTGSRSALILVVLAIVSYIYIGAYQQKWSFLKLLALTIVLIAIISLGFYLIMNLPVLYNILGIRVLSFFQITHGMQSVYQESSTFVRMQYIEEGLKWFIESPIFGHGIDSFQKFNSVYMGGTGFSHCDYVELLSALGVIGAGLFFFPFIKFLKPLFKRSSYEEARGFSILLSSLSIEFLVGEVFLVMYYEKEIWLLIPLMIRMYKIICDKPYDVECEQSWSF